jgi:NAD(P)-dependent dehydrogenase (short-subunit alcohol dehydrogenase family)
MRASFDYTGRAVFVAGGTSGINLGIAQAFAAAGARLGVGSRKPEKVEAAVAALGPGALGYAFDVRDPAAVAEAIAGFAAEAGPIDVLVSGAAGNFPALAKDLSPNGFKAVVDIDLLGTFHVMRAAYPHMRRPGGSLINVSAPQAAVPMAFQVHVCAAKAGVDMVTRCLAIEWAPEGLRVNGVVPGPIEGTEGMARLAPTDAARRAIAQGVPQRRLGTPDDVARACLFLGSDAAAYVNGAILPADGGWMLAGARMTGA